jgi:glycosyltransferase involved in cell wall biosynthesis
MKIALLTDGIHPYVIGGMQKYAFNLTKYLAGKGHEVYLFHCNESKYNPELLEFFTEEERKNIHSFVIPFPHHPKYPFHYFYESWLYSKAIYRQYSVSGLKPDFILAQGFCGWYMLVHRKNKEVPIAIHLHGFEMYQVMLSSSQNVSSIFLRMVAKKNLRLADYGISFGGKITEILSQIISKNKIWEIPGGIPACWADRDEKWLQTDVSQNDILRFVFTGRYERRKGIEELIIALKELLGNGDFTFEFIGNIPMEMRINSPEITYHGQVDSETEMQKILKRCDVLVCPSWSEGMPTVIMEAMACGLAIIATDVGAVSQLVSAENGWLLPAPAPNLISAAMKDAILLEKEKLKEKKLNSLNKIKKFTIGAGAEMLVKKIVSF